MATLSNKKMYKSKTQLGKLTKAELEEYGRTIGIELDRRLKHGTLVDDIEARMRSLMPWSLKLNTLVDDIEAVEMANRLSKKQLEDYGRTIGIELDRRLKKETLIKELVEHMAKKKGKSIIKKAKEAVKRATSKNVLLRDANTGTWSEGPKPAGKSQHGTSRGVPYWEI